MESMLHKETTQRTVLRHDWVSRRRKPSIRRPVDLRLGQGLEFGDLDLHSRHAGMAVVDLDAPARLPAAAGRQQRAPGLADAHIP